MENTIKSFLGSRGLVDVISFSGGFIARENDAKEKIEEAIKVYKNYPVAILTGGTKWNLPGAVTQIAKDHGMAVIGVMPQKGFKHKASGLDLEIVVGPRYGQSAWGDETEIFAKASDAMQIMGGGPGAGVELFYLLKLNADREHKGAEPIPIASIGGFGGVTDMIYEPPFEIPTFDMGYEAAKYILDKLGYPDFED